MKAAKGRKLRALIVHDTAFPEEVESILGTSSVDLCSINFGDDQVQNKIGAWVDVLQVLESLAAPNRLSYVNIDIPDLLFIDCHFSSDKQSPPLWAEEDRDEAKSKRVDPRGLLYGAVLAAYFMGQQRARPFGFAVYSQDLETAADNGYALTFFSLLDALAGNIEKDFIRYSQFVSRMKSTPRNQMPGPVLGDALAMYRNGLLLTMSSDCYPVLDSFEAAEDSLRRWLKSGDPLIGDVSISWHTINAQMETVSLSSIFADCVVDGEWSRERVEELGVIDFLESVQGDEGHEAEVLKPVEDRLKLLLANKDAGKWPEGYVGYKQKTLAYTILWALDRIESSVDKRRRGQAVKLAGVMDLDHRIGLINKEVNRALGRVLGNSDLTRGASEEKSYQAQMFLKNLDGHTVWPYPSPPWLRPLVKKFLSRHLDKRGDVGRSDWPRNLRGD